MVGAGTFASCRFWSEQVEHVQAAGAAGSSKHVARRGQRQGQPATPTRGGRQATAREHYNLLRPCCYFEQLL